MQIWHISDDAPCVHIDMPHGDFYGIEAIEVKNAFAPRHFYVDLVVMTPRSPLAEVTHN